MTWSRDILVRFTLQRVFQLIWTHQEQKPISELQGVLSSFPDELPLLGNDDIEMGSSQRTHIAPLEAVLFKLHTFIV